MQITRRHLLGAGAALAATGTTVSLGLGRALAQDAMGGTAMNTIMGANGDITVHPVSHASLALEGAGKVIYADPVGDASAYEGLPPADLVLVTHEHGDHYNAETLGSLVGDNTMLLTNPAVFDMLPAELKSKAQSVANGGAIEIAGVQIDAIPAYNITEGRLQYHPEGRDNGYILMLDGKRVYIAGDTEGIPEMRALTDIDLAFVPMNLPFTMDVDQAADAVAEFKPAVVYPYHYRDSDVEAFKQMVADAAPDVEVRLGDWY